MNLSDFQFSRLIFLMAQAVFGVSSEDGSCQGAIAQPFSSALVIRFEGCPVEAGGRLHLLLAPPLGPPVGEPHLKRCKIEQKRLRERHLAANESGTRATH